MTDTQPTNDEEEAAFTPFERKIRLYGWALAVVAGLVFFSSRCGPQPTLAPEIPDGQILVSAHDLGQMESGLIMFLLANQKAIEAKEIPQSVYVFEVQQELARIQSDAGYWGGMKVEPEPPR